MDYETGPHRQKVIKNPKNIELDEAVYVLFLEKQVLGVPQSGPLICEKDIDFNTKLNGDKEFKASSG